jgi:hypothetical protein
MRVPSKSVATAFGIAGLVAAGLCYEASQAPRFSLNDLEVEAAPGAGATDVAASWSDETGQTRTARMAVEHAEPTQHWSIEIRPAGRKNDQSLGHQVWLLGVAAPDPIELTQLPPAPGWKLHYWKSGHAKEGLVAWEAATAALHAEIAGGTLLLRFRRDSRGGMAEVTANGRMQTVDLYADVPDSVTLVWQPQLPAEATGAARWVRTRIQGYPRRAEGIRLEAEPRGSAVIRSVRFRGVLLAESAPGVFLLPGVFRVVFLRAILVFLAGFLLLSATLVLIARAWRDGAAKGKLAPRSLMVAGAVTISAFWTAVFFPGTMSPDSMNQWQQAVTGHYAAWHPLGMTLVMRAIHLAMASWSMNAQIAVNAWLQGTLFWGAIFALLDLGALPLRRKIVLCVLMAAYYPLWLFTITLWKDVWLAIAWFTLLWWSKPYFLARLWTLRGWMGMVLLLAFSMLQRHTMWVSFFALAGFWGLHRLFKFGWHKELRFALISAAGLAGAFSIQAIVHRVLKPEDNGKLVNWTLLYEVAGTVHFSSRPLDEWQSLRTYQFLGKARFEQVARDFTCGGSLDYLVYPPGHPMELEEVLEGRFAIDDLPVVVSRSPLAYLQQRGCSVAHVMGLVHGEIPPLYRETIEENRFGITEASLLPRVRRLVVRLEHAATRSRVFQLPLRHGLVVLASGLAALLMSLGMRRSPNRQVVLYLFAAGVVLLCPLLVITPAPDWRYLMPANVCWACGVLISLASLRSG